MSDDVKTHPNAGPKPDATARRAANKIVPLPRKPLSATIADQLRAAIHDATFMPGERLVEQSLAREFKVSRGPIRDAFRELEREGLIVSETNRGTYVAHLKPADLQEIYSLRLALDQLAVALACREATQAQLGEMAAVLDQMRHAVSAALSGRDAVELDLQFHDAIYRSAGHSRLIAFWDSLRPQIKTMLLERVTQRPDFTEILVPFHKILFDVIAIRDEDRARKLIADHIGNAYQPVADALKDGQSRIEAGKERSA